MALLLFQSCIFVVAEKKTGPADSLILIDSSTAYPNADTTNGPAKSIATADSALKDTAQHNNLALPKGSIDTKNIHPQQVVEYAKTLIGIKYRYGSTNPAVGFDCSGFITHVFSHFGIVVPRSSIDFTNVGKEVAVTDAKPGDLILFTGTDSSEHFVGHMGLIVSNESGQVNFIHSTSGKAYGVTITPLNGYYKGRYVKTTRIFPANG